MTKEFATAALDPEDDGFVIYIAAFNTDSGYEMYILRRAQIAYFKEDEALVEVS